MKLVFQASSGAERTIAYVNDDDEVMGEIKRFCQERDFKIPYTRTWEKDGVVTFDVGSHTEFFKLYKDN
nr:MAG TPA: hypothetical protein [Caudoviricetes sp.]